MGLPAYHAKFEGQYEWQNEATGITVANGALAVDGRDYTTVDAIADANKKIITLDDGTAAIEVRVRTDGAEDDSNVLQVYAMRGDSDHYQRVCQLTVLQGKQDCSVGHFGDEFTLANDAWHNIANIRAQVGVQTVTDEIGRFRMNTLGYKKILFVVSTLDASTTTVYVDWCRRDLEW